MNEWPLFTQTSRVSIQMEIKLFPKPLFFLKVHNDFCGGVGFCNSEREKLKKKKQAQE